MARVLLVNNFRKPDATWLIRLRDALAKEGATVAVSPHQSASDRLFREYDAVVLSGSFAMLSRNGTANEFRNELDAVAETSVPLLGVCFGHQLMAHAFGSRVVRGRQPTERYVKSEILQDEELFHGLPGRPSFYESHYEEVPSVPPNFRLLAKSPSSPVSAMKHKFRPLYGVQFHPEKNSRINPEGAALISNFLRSTA